MGDNVHTAFGLTDYLGIWLGKILTSATRLAGRGGTTFPGRLSLKLAPGILSGLSRQTTGGNIVITGTNGKTTTTALLAHILQTAGYSTVSNNTGSNLSWGIATSLINASTWGGKLNCRYGVLEVDEGFFPGLAGQLQPVGAVVTNIFPDQLDRFGGVDNIQQSINRGLVSMPAHSFQILNADDPFLASLEKHPGPTWYYGLEVPPAQNRQLFGHQGQGYICPHCRQILGYRQVFLAHLGHYRCPGCGFERPHPEVALLDYSQTPEGTAILKLDLKGRREEMQCLLPGSYNVYNLLAGLTAALALGIPVNTIKRALSSFSRVNGRLQRIELRDGKKSVVIALIKNAVGVDQALTHLLFGRGWNPAPTAYERGLNRAPTAYEKGWNPAQTVNGREWNPAPGIGKEENRKQEKISLLIAINDRLADGVDVSWLWNAGFEQLAGCQENFYTVTVSGTRAWDMAVRLKYAGLDCRRIMVEKNLELALKFTLKATPPGKTVYILPNYTALAALNRALRSLEPQGLRSN